MKNPAYKIYIKVIIVQIQISDAIISRIQGGEVPKVRKVTEKSRPLAKSIHKLRDSGKSSPPPSPNFSRIQITRCKHEIRDATPTHRDQPPPFFFFFIITKEVVER